LAHQAYGYDVSLENQKRLQLAAIKMKDELTKKIAEVLRKAAELKAEAGYGEIERVISCQLGDYPTTDLLAPPQLEKKGPARHWPQGWEIFSWVAAIGILSATFLPALTAARSDCSARCSVAGRYTTTFDAGFWFPSSSISSTGGRQYPSVLPIFNA
jgi:hypothetical protein